MDAHEQRARLLLFQQRRYDLAERELRETLRMQPDHAVAHAMLGHCLTLRGAHPEALACLAEALRLAPDMPYCHSTHGWTLRQLRRLPEAEVALKEALRLDPYEPYHFDELSTIYRLQGRPAEAVRVARQGLERNPEDVGCLNSCAVALGHLGHLREAEAMIQRALARAPEDPRTRCNVGWILLWRRQAQEAAAEFQEALRLDPQCDSSRQGLKQALVLRLQQRGYWIVALTGFLAVGSLALLWTDLSPRLTRAICALAWSGFLAGVLLCTVGLARYFCLGFGRLGRSLLTVNDERAATLVAAGVLLALTWVVVWLITDQELFAKLAIGAYVLVFFIDAACASYRDGS
jgi:Flp pilus assembly protein TadD